MNYTKNILSKIHLHLGNKLKETESESKDPYYGLNVHIKTTHYSNGEIHQHRRKINDDIKIDVVMLINPTFATRATQIRYSLFTKHPIKLFDIRIDDPEGNILIMLNLDK